MKSGPTHPMRAALWMIGAIVSFSVMAVAGRELSRQLDTFEIMLYRSLIGFVIVLVISRLTGSHRSISTRNIPIQLIRNIAHFTGQNLWFLAIALIPLAQVFALEFTSPIWAMFLAVVILGERLTLVRLISAAIGFAGILIITQPWGVALGPGVIAGALAAVAFGATAVFTRLLTRSETVTSILFWLTSLQLIFATICAGYDGDIAQPTQDTWPWLFAIAITGLIAHFSITKALSLAPAAIVMPVDFTRLPLIAMVGYFLYDEKIELAVILGGAMILGANFINIRAETRAKHIK